MVFFQPFVNNVSGIRWGSKTGKNIANILSGQEKKEAAAKPHHWRPTLLRGGVTAQER
jgi:hypothetical protein